MNCKTMKAKSIMSSIMLVIGILVGVLAQFLSTNTAYSIEYLYGVSCGLIFASIFVLIINFIRGKNPKLKHQDIVNEEDERNQMITMHSISISYIYLFYGITLCFLLNLFIPLSFHLVSFFLLISTCIVQGIATYYYRKKY